MLAAVVAAEHERPLVEVGGEWRPPDVGLGAAAVAAVHADHLRT